MLIPDKITPIGIQLPLESRVRHLTKGGGSNVALDKGIMCYFLKASDPGDRKLQNNFNLNFGTQLNKRAAKFGLYLTFLKLEVTTIFWMIFYQRGVWRRIRG